MINVVACPFINKGLHTHKVWLHNMQRIRMPRKEMKLLFVDMAKDDEITALYKKFIEEHGNEWKEVRYEKDPPKKYKDVSEAPSLHENVDLFVTKRKTVSETFQIINQFRKEMGGGDMLCHEDDIGVSENAFEVMYPYLGGDVWAVSCEQIARTKEWNDGKSLLAWDPDPGLVDPYNISINEIKETGTREVGATATGFHFYSGEFLDQYDFPVTDNYGQDVNAGLNINRLGKKLVLVWDIKATHFEALGTDKALIFKSDLCKTPLYDIDGTDMTPNPKYIYQPVATGKKKCNRTSRKSCPQFIWS